MNQRSQGLANNLNLNWFGRDMNSSAISEGDVVHNMTPVNEPEHFQRLAIKDQTRATQKNDKEKEWFAEELGSASAAQKTKKPQAMWQLKMDGDTCKENRATYFKSCGSELRAELNGRKMEVAELLQRAEEGVKVDMEKDYNEKLGAAQTAVDAFEKQCEDAAKEVKDTDFGKMASAQEISEMIIMINKGKSEIINKAKKEAKVQWGGHLPQSAHPWLRPGGRGQGPGPGPGARGQGPGSGAGGQGPGPGPRAQGQGPGPGAMARGHLKPRTRAS